MATALIIKTCLLSAPRLHHHHHHHRYPLLFSTTSPKPPKSQSLKSIKMESGNEITEEAKENVNQKKKKIFVAGATGSTGKRIVEQLLAKGFEVKAGVRDLDKAKTVLSEHNPSLQIVTADVTEGSDKLVQAIGDDSEAVICATGFRPSWNLFSPWKVDNLGTVNLVEACRKLGVKRFILISSILVNGAAMGQLLNPARGEAGFEPDIVVYNNLLSGYAMAGKMGDAFDLLKEIRRKGCDPNATSYTILIQALCGQEKMDEAMRVFVEMERSGCDADVVTYTALVSGFCKWRMIDKGYQILQSMIQKGHMPNQLTYLHLMLAHEKKEELEECKELMGEMQKIGCIPDLSIYNVVIRLACKLGEVNAGVDAWNEMEVSGLSPGLDTFVIMINGFLGHGYLVEACQYFKEMVERGLLSSRQYGILKDLLNALLRGEKLELAKDLWSCIVTKGCELNVDSWTIWIHALFSNGHVKEACSYCLDMMDADLMPKPETFAKLMRGLRKLYNRQFAAEITEKVRKMAADRHVTFKMYKRRGERDLIEKAKAKKDGRKRRARRRQWGGGHNRASIL